MSGHTGWQSLVRRVGWFYIASAALGIALLALALGLWGYYTPLRAEADGLGVLSFRALQTFRLFVGPIAVAGVALLIPRAGWRLALALYALYSVAYVAYREPVPPFDPVAATALESPVWRGVNHLYATGDDDPKWYSQDEIGPNPALVRVEEARGAMLAEAKRLQQELRLRTDGARRSAKEIMDKILRRPEEL